jgi:hypothetical protein
MRAGPVDYKLSQHSTREAVEETLAAEIQQPYVGTIITRVITEVDRNSSGCTETGQQAISLINVHTNSAELIKVDSDLGKLTETGQNPLTRTTQNLTSQKNSKSIGKGQQSDFLSNVNSKVKNWLKQAKQHQQRLQPIQQHLGQLYQ